MTTAIIIGVVLVFGFVLGILLKPERDEHENKYVTWKHYSDGVDIVDRNVRILDRKITLILKEIGKEYQPARDVHEEAKLVDKKPTCFVYPESYNHITFDGDTAKFSWEDIKLDKKSTKKTTKKKKA